MIAHYFARLVLIVLLALPLAARAQDVATPDYKEWGTLAGRAEDQITEFDVSNTELESLRETLTVWRESFLSAEGTNATRIETLRAQLAALGPIPAEGESESAEIADRRKALTAQLDSAQAPVKAAEEAYTRANGLIAEIDQILSDRQAKALMKLGPSPLNPTLWPEAIRAIAGTGYQAWTSILDNASSTTTQATLKANAATLLMYLLIALVLVARGRRWSEEITRFVRERVTGDAGQGVTGFLASLSQIIVPLAGIYAITEAAQVSTLLGPRGAAIFAALPKIGLAYFLSRWIAGRLFYPTGAGEVLFDLTPTRRVEAAGVAMLAGVMYALNDVLQPLAEIDQYSEGTHAVLSFPLVVITAVALFRLMRLLGGSVVRPQGEGEDTVGLRDLGFVALISRSVSRIVVIATVLALCFGAAGYMSAAQSLIFPMVLSLALFGLLVVLSRLAHDVYALVTRQQGGDLVPVLLAFALVLLSVPFFALIWGMRPDQLWEVYARMREGVSLGGVQISVTDLVTLALVFAVGLGLTRLLKSALSSAILPKTRLDKGGQNALVAGAGYLGIFISAVVAVMAAGIDLSALAIVAGALSVGIGFGLQNIVQNFVSGIILLIERPISEGDWIDVGNGQMGFVRDISVRSTRVETFDRTDLIVPNADLISNQVTNYTRGNLIGRVIVPVGVAYGTDTRRVETILREIAEAHPMVTLNPAPQVYFLNFGADALEFEIRAILKDVTYIVAVKNDINHEIARRFGEEGIEIPFAQRDIWLRNPEALRTSPAAGAHQEAPAPEHLEAEDFDAGAADSGDGDGEGT